MEDMKAIKTLPEGVFDPVPWLLIHGGADGIVPIEDSREIFALANEPKK